jgi:hypothetical protein
MRGRGVKFTVSGRNMEEEFQGVLFEKGRLYERK